MVKEKELFELEPRQAGACEFCGAKNTDTRVIAARATDGVQLFRLRICKPCLMQFTLDAAEALFHFDGTENTKTPEDLPASR